MKTTKLSYLICTAVAALSLSVQGGIVVGGSEGTFQSGLQAGYFNDTFSGSATHNPYTFNNGTYSGTITAAGSSTYEFSGMLLAGDVAGGATFTFNTFLGGVSAVGANMFLSNSGDATGRAGTISVGVTYSDASTANTGNLSLLLGDTPFVAITAPTGLTISSITFATSTGPYTAIDNFNAGAVAVPEPSVWGFCVGSGLVVFGAYRRMRK